MRICLVNLGALPALSQEHKHQRIGGEEVQHAQLAAALSRLGHDVSLVVADSGQPDGAVFEGVRTLKAYKEAAGLPGLRFIYPRWAKLWSAISRANADVYYCSCAGMLVGMLAMYCRLHQRGWSSGLRAARTVNRKTCSSGIDATAGSMSTD
jgi:hypothetical protein